MFRNRLHQLEQRQLKMDSHYFLRQGKGPRTIFKLNKTYWEFGPEIPYLRPSHHLKPGRPKVIVKPNIQVKNFRNIQPGVPIFVQGAPSSNGVRTVIPTQVQIPRNVTTQEWA